MTRFPHDRFAKQFLSDLLDPLGTVQPERKVTDETKGYLSIDGSYMGIVV